MPYGGYDIGPDEGWVSVSEDGDTVVFAVASSCTWWQTIGVVRYPDATRLMITADAGGSKGYRVRLWKTGPRSSPRRPACRSWCATTRGHQDHRPATCRRPADSA